MNIYIFKKKILNKNDSLQYTTLKLFSRKKHIEWMFLSLIKSALMNIEAPSVLLN